MNDTGQSGGASEIEDAGVARGTKVGLALLGAVVLLSVGVLGVVLISGARSSKAARQAVPGPYAHLDRTEVGDPAAKVQVLALVPLRTNCHTPSVSYLLTAARAHPQQIHVRFMDRRLPHGEAEIKRLKLTCASLVCNGRTLFALPDGRKVKLEGGPEEEFSVADLRLVLQGLADQAYGAGAVKMPDIPAADEQPAPPARP